MKMTRRQLAALAPALAAGQSVAAGQSATQSAAQSAAQSKDAKDKPVLPSKCYLYEDMVVKKNAANGNEQRAVFDAVTHGKYPVELHITSLAAGQAPHAPHHHVHEEALMARSGLLDVTIEGKTTRVTAGSVVVVRSNEEHGWKNPGPERSEYFVIALGKES
jgi:mannose-6-phosphate isomerase-like protein (cupin superfamily)